MMRYLKLILIIALFLNSCSYTKNLWSYKTYDETVGKFLIIKNEEKTEIAFIGEKYHYIFDDLDLINEVITWKSSSKMELIDYKFIVTSPSDISGEITLRIKYTFQQNLNSKKVEYISEKERNFLVSKGFVENKKYSTFYLEKKFNLKGQRYFPKKGVNYFDNMSEFDKIYEFKVTEEYDSYLRKTKKIALTPFAVAGDTLTIASGLGPAVVLVSFFALVYFPALKISCMKKGEKSCH